WQRSLMPTHYIDPLSAQMDIWYVRGATTHIHGSSYCDVTANAHANNTTLRITSLRTTRHSQSPEVLAIDVAKRQHTELPYVGYGLQADVYSSGVVLGSLLFQQHEDEVADLSNSVAKGDAYLTRVLARDDEDDAPPAELINAYSLMVRMLDPDLDTRITVE